MYLIVAISSFTLSYFLFKKASGNMEINKLNMISSVYYFHLLAPYFLSSVLIVYGLDNHYLINKISDERSKIMGFWILNYAIVLIPLGMILASKLWRVNPKNLFNYYVNSSLDTYLTKRDSYIRYPLYLLSLISVLSIFYVFLVAGEFPLLSLLKGASSLVLGVLRNEIGREFSGIKIIKDLFAITLMPILSYVAYGYYKITRSKFDKYWFILLFISSFIILTYNLAKAPLIYYLLGFLYFNIYNNKTFNKKTIVSVLLGIFGVLIGFYVALSAINVDLIFAINHGPLGRLFLTQSAGFYLTIDAFPKYHDHLGWSTVSESLSNTLGLSHSVRSSRILMLIYNKAAVKEGIAGVMNSLFVAEAYANFGFIGAFLSPLYVGFVIQNFYIILLRLKKSPLFMAILTYYSLRSVVNGGFNDYIYNPILTILLLLLFSIPVVARLMSNNFSK